MLKKELNNVGVIILAAGKGTRLNCTDRPKVMLEIGGKPIVSYIVETLLDAGFAKEQIVLVVGFKKERVKEYFGGTVIYADQDKQLGTAQAAYVGMRELPQDIETVLIIGGDDSAFYKKETLLDFIGQHAKNGATLSLLTTESESFEDMGRIIRDESGNFVKVLEKEELSEEQKEIKETSTGTYCFDKDWFEEIFPEMKQIEGLGELGLSKAVEMAVEHKKKIQAVKLKNNGEWFGINTEKELEEADFRISNGPYIRCQNKHLD